MHSTSCPVTLHEGGVDGQQCGPHGPQPRALRRSEMENRQEESSHPPIEFVGNLWYKVVPPR
jgi:hypothetical protein